MKSLTITNTIKPLRSRFRGQGYVNCLNAGDDSFTRMSSDIPRDDWRYATSSLVHLCSVSDKCLDQVLKNAQPNDDGLSDNKMKVRTGVMTWVIQLQTKLCSGPPESCVSRIQAREEDCCSDWTLLS